MSVAGPQETSICVPLTATAVRVPGAEGFSVSGAPLMDVRSLAALLPVLTSPPPLTVAVLVTLDGAVAATSTVSVIAA